MYLARREAGKNLQIFKTDGAERIPRAWLFDPWESPNGARTNPALCEPGCAATGNTRSEAIENLHIAEEHFAHA